MLRSLSCGLFKIEAFKLGILCKRRATKSSNSNSFCDSRSESSPGSSWSSSSYTATCRASAATWLAKLNTPSIPVGTPAARTGFNCETPQVLRVACGDAWDQFFRAKNTNLDARPTRTGMQGCCHTFFAYFTFISRSQSRQSERDGEAFAPAESAAAHCGIRLLLLFCRFGDQTPRRPRRHEKTSPEGWPLHSVKRERRHARAFPVPVKRRAGRCSPFAGEPESRCRLHFRSARPARA